jgi:hypothetical protein
MSTAPCPDLLLRDPGELIATIPTLLGFRPTDCLVLIVYTGHAPHRFLGAVLRIDLPQPQDLGAWVDQLCAVVANQDGTGVGLLVLGGARTSSTEDSTAPTTGPRADPVAADLPARDLIDALGTALTEAGTVIVDALWAASVDADSWRCYRNPARRGAIPDPMALPVVAALTVDGACSYGSREERAAVLDPDPAEDIARRTDLLAGLPAVQPDREIRFLMELVDRVHSGAEGAPVAGEPVVDDATIARLAHALADGRVRDGALALSVGPRAAAAEWVWTVLVRGAPRVLVAMPAYLLGVCAYLRGDGPLAGIALDLACQSDPSHPVAGQVRQALCLGIPPTELRRALEASVAQWVDEQLSAAGTVHSGRCDEQPTRVERA